MANGNFGGGDGSEVSPYLVEDIEDFLLVRKWGSVMIGPTRYFKQVNDLDFSGVSFEDTLDRVFNGVYDGGYKKNRNLTIQNTTRYTTVGGLFQTLENASIKNVFLESCSIKAATTVGGIAGTARNSLIRNCSVKGNIIINPPTFGAIGTIGGIVGSFDGRIEDCYADVNLSYIIQTGDSPFGRTVNMGGIVGSPSRETIIKNVYMIGSMSGYGSRVGSYYGFTPNPTPQVINSFYDYSKTMLVSLNGGTTTTLEKSSSEVTSEWDFVNVWIENARYPDLRIPGAILCKSTPVPFTIKKMKTL